MKKKYLSFDERIKFLLKTAKKKKETKIFLDKSIIEKRKNLFNEILKVLPKSFTIINLKSKSKEKINVHAEFNEKTGSATIIYIKENNKTPLKKTDLCLNEADNLNKFSKEYLNSWKTQILEEFDLFFEDKFKRINC